MGTWKGLGRCFQAVSSRIGRHFELQSACADSIAPHMAIGGKRSPIEPRDPLILALNGLKITGFGGPQARSAWRKQARSIVCASWGRTKARRRSLKASWPSLGHLKVFSWAVPKLLRLVRCILSSRHHGFGSKMRCSSANRSRTTQVPVQRSREKARGKELSIGGRTCAARASRGVRLGPSHSKRGAKSYQNGSTWIKMASDRHVLTSP